MASSNLEEWNGSYHQSKQARDSHKRRHRAGQGGPEAQLVNREEKQTDIGNPWNDKINEMLGIGHRFGDPTVPVDQNESQDGESRKGGHKGRHPTAAETAEPRRQTDDGAPDQEIQQISHLTHLPNRASSTRSALSMRDGINPPVCLQPDITHPPTQSH